MKNLRSSVCLVECKEMSENNVVCKYIFISLLLIILCTAIALRSKTSK